MTKTLTVQNVEQAACFLELDGQISDGFWENAKPYDHYKPWTSCEVVVAASATMDDARLGRNFYAQKDNYNFTAPELLSVVGRRMLGVVRIARAFGIAMAETFEHRVDCSDGKIDWTDMTNLRAATDWAETLGVNSIEVKNRIDAALVDETYGMRELKSDLIRLKAIVKRVNR